jgi:hypothetical protein
MRDNNVDWSTHNKEPRQKRLLGFPPEPIYASGKMQQYPFVHLKGSWVSTRKGDPILRIQDLNMECTHA